MDNWQGTSFQLVWFTAAAHRLRSDSIYAAFLGSEPDSVAHSKSPTQQNPIFSTSTGDLGGIQYSVTLQFGRVDIVLAPPPALTGLNLKLPGKFDSIVGQISNSVSSVCDLVPEVNRLAMVSVFSKPAMTMQECVSSLNRLLGNDIIKFPDPSEFFLQVNRRKNFSGFSGEMNRLVKYSIVPFQQILLHQPSGQTTPVGDEIIALQLSLDVNSVPLPRELSREEQVSIFSELIAETKILRRADGTKGLL